MGSVHGIINCGFSLGFSQTIEVKPKGKKPLSILVAQWILSKECSKQIGAPHPNQMAVLVDVRHRRTQNTVGGMTQGESQPNAREVVHQNRPYSLILTANWRITGDWESCLKLT